MARRLLPGKMRKCCLLQPNVFLSTFDLALCSSFSPRSLPSKHIASAAFTCPDNECFSAPNTALLSPSTRRESLQACAWGVRMGRKLLSGQLPPRRCRRCPARRPVQSRSKTRLRLVFNRLVGPRCEVCYVRRSLLVIRPLCCFLPYRCAKLTTTNDLPVGTAHTSP